MSEVNETMRAEEYLQRPYKNSLISGSVTVGGGIGAARVDMWGMGTLAGQAPWEATVGADFAAVPDPATTKKQIEEAVAAERTRILAVLHDLRPYDEPYKRREWEWERKGAKEMHAKIIRAIEGEK